MTRVGWILILATAVQASDELAAAQERGYLAQVQKIVRKLRARDSAALHALMMKLDAGRSGAFVSAHIIARNLLLDATRTGDSTYVADAAMVIGVHAKKKNISKCATAMKHYADALTAENAEAATAAMGKALYIMRSEGWTYLTMHAAVEFAARTRDGKKAAAAIEKVADLFPPDADPSLRSVFRGLVEKRLADAPKEVSDACAHVMAPHQGGMSASAAGGKGGKGGAGGAGGLAKVGDALPRYSSRKPLVTIKRTPDGFEMREGFDKSYRHTQKRKHGIKYHNDGGVTIGFWGNAVALKMLDPSGLNGPPGESSAAPRAYLAYYFLARKETWGFTKTGVVVIK